MSALALDDGTVIILGLSGTVLVSKDGRSSFTAANNPDRQDLAAAVQLGSGLALAVGEAGVTRIHTLPADHVKPHGPS